MKAEEQSHKLCFDSAAFIKGGWGYGGRDSKFLGGGNNSIWGNLTFYGGTF